MRIQFRHIFLIIGMVCVIISFLFFGRGQSTYSFLLIAGLLVSITSFLFILFKDPKRLKITWTIIVVLGVLVQRVTERYFISQSFKSLIENNKEILNKTNNIFISKPGNVLYLKTDSISSEKIFSQEEEKTISQLLEETNIQLIVKDSSKIYYETYGMLDVRIGFTFLYSKSSSDFGTGLTSYIGKWDY